MYPIARRKVWILESFLLLGTSEGGRQCRSWSMAAPILLILLRSRALALCLCLLIPVSLGFRRRFRFAATVWVFACGFAATTIWTMLSKWNTSFLLESQMISREVNEKLWKLRDLVIAKCWVSGSQFCLVRLTMERTIGNDSYSRKELKTARSISQQRATQVMNCSLAGSTSRPCKIKLFETR